MNRVELREGRPHPPATLAAVEILPGVQEACRALATAGFLLICVTNQPDIARGTARREEVDAINEFVRGRLGLDAVRVCAHDDLDGCDCRKPKPGLLIHGAHELGVALAESVMVGDRWRDIEAGRNAGCRTVFIDRRYDERKPASSDFTCDSLLAAIPWILEQSDKRS